MSHDLTNRNSHPNARDDEQVFAVWTAQRMPAIYGPNIINGVVDPVIPLRLYGSGVLVTLPDGNSAVLTAVHVVLPAITRGALFVHVPGLGTRPAEPRSIRLCRRSDVALLTLHENFAQSLNAGSWDSRNHPPFNVGEPYLACGYPGRAVIPPNPLTGQPGRMEGYIIETSLTQLNAFGGLHQSHISNGTQLPDTIGGMSGGPVFDINGHLAGVNTLEATSGNLVTDVLFTPRPAWDDLIYPLSHPAGIAPDLWRSELSYSGIRLRLSVPVRGSTRRVTLAEFTATIVGEVWRSESQATNPGGTRGAIQRILIDNSRYRILS